MHVLQSLSMIGVLISQVLKIVVISAQYPQ